MPLFTCRALSFRSFSSILTSIVYLFLALLNIYKYKSKENKSILIQYQILYVLVPIRLTVCFFSPSFVPVCKCCEDNLHLQPMTTPYPTTIAQSKQITEIKSRISFRTFVEQSSLQIEPFSIPENRNLYSLFIYFRFRFVTPIIWDALNGASRQNINGYDFIWSSELHFVSI